MRMGQKLWICVALVVPGLVQAAPGDGLREALEAARGDSWEAGQARIAEANEIEQDLFEWHRLRDDDSNATFADCIAFVDKRADWPQIERIRARCEERIDDTVSNRQIEAWFEDEQPLTGQGAVAYAHVLDEDGKTDEANEMLGEIWATQSLTSEGAEAMLEAYGPELAPQHEARTEMLLWKSQTGLASQMLPLLEAAPRATAEARIALITKDANADDSFANLVPGQRKDAGLAYDRFTYLAEKGQRTAATDILLGRSGSAEELGVPFRWSGWRRILARNEMRAGNYERAYEVASTHQLEPEDGFVYVDLEWLAGYIALRYLDDAEAAMPHFNAIEKVAVNPIAKGRAYYWQGRAYEAMGEAKKAQAAYEEGGKYQTGFYGLLAAEKAGLPYDPALTGNEEVPAWSKAAFLREDKPRAALTLLAAGERVSAVSFFGDLGRELDATELAQMGQVLARIDEPFFQVLLGKAGAEREIIVPAIYFPLHPMVEEDYPVNMPLALAVARRESEFRTDAGSSVGALGLMQLMPATAEEVSGQLGLPFSRAGLTSDWQYNAKLGTQYLAGLEERFGPSPVYIAAGYNAGPGRPAQWIAQYGDPRTGEIDVVDWIELIPFRETRNYVQRVAEAIPVYHARLNGEVPDYTFSELLIGLKPLTRPVGRPEDLETEPEQDTEAAAE